MRLGWVVISCFAIIQGAAGVHPRLRNEFNREEMIAWGLAELWGTSALHERRTARNHHLLLNNIHGASKFSGQFFDGMWSVSGSFENIYNTRYDFIIDTIMTDPGFWRWRRREVTAVTILPRNRDWRGIFSLEFLLRRLVALCW